MRTALAIVLIALSATAAHAQNWIIQGAERDFRVEWSTTTEAGGAVMDGYIYNARGVAAHQVRLLIEQLDATGAVTRQSVGYVPGVVAGAQRTYFRVPVPAAPGYRVKVGSYDWIEGGPMQ